MTGRSPRRWRPAVALRGLVALALCAPAPARADADEVGPRPARAFALTLDNDIFAASDKHYTSGVRLALGLPAPRPLVARAAASGRTCDLALVFGQQIFTPENLTSSHPVEDDRPYAGWLYGGIVLRLRGGDPWDLPGGRPVLDTFELDVGVVGPGSLADATQRTVHRLLNATEPAGWEHQVRHGPAIQLSWVRRVRLLHGRLPLGLEVDLTPHVGATAGTVVCSARAGATVRLGWGLPPDFGGFEDDPVALPLPLDPAAAPAPGLGLWLVARADARASIFDVLLENSPLRSGGHGVQREPLVGTFQLGLVLSLRERVLLGYTHTVRTPEFEGQGGPDMFGSLFLQVGF
ncbi:MAG: lipid A deacylase LpxR family protein [Planctomycetes bacterium]|nr:lipid A deacylase LpxR family protein [Planctomycetota bacterium]